MNKHDDLIKALAKQQSDLCDDAAAALREVGRERDDARAALAKLRIELADLSAEHSKCPR